MTAIPDKPSLPRKPRYLTLGLAGLLAAALAAAWAMLRIDPRARRLPDGTLLRLEAIGRPPLPLHLRDTWQEWLGPFLPPGRRSYGTLTTIGELNRHDAVFWLSSRSGTPRITNRARAEAVDEHGCRLAFGGYYHTAGSFTFTGTAMNPGRADQLMHRSVQGALPRFPRRSAAFELRLYTEDGRGPTEFSVPNPARGPHPYWNGRTCPVVSRDGAAAFTLSEIATAMDWAGLTQSQPAVLPGHLQAQLRLLKRLWLIDPDSPTAPGWTRLRFRLAEHERSASDWEPVRVTVEDATGNLLVCGVEDGLLVSEVDRNGSVWCAFPDGLCARETWKVRVEFSRRPEAAFPPDEIWSVPGVVLPPAGTWVRPPGRATRHGMTLELGSLSWTPEQAGTEPGGKKLWVRVRAPRYRAGLNPTLRITDDRGRAVSCARPRANRGDTIRAYDFHAYLPGDTHRVNLAFGLARSRFAEFVVSPGGPSGQPTPGR